MRVIRFGVFEAHLAAGELYKSGRLVRLQQQPFGVLRALLERSGEVVTRDELRRALWPQGITVDFDQSLNKCVTKLRDALGDEAASPRFIETLPKRGYRFIADVRSSEEALTRRRPTLIRSSRRSSRSRSQPNTERHAQPGFQGWQRWLSSP